MVAMRIFCIALLVCGAACAKKPAPKTPAQPTPDTVERTAPAAAPAVKKGDPCSGGEVK
jgi:hypothetical protein